MYDIVIIGGSGFIGSYLANYLLNHKLVNNLDSFDFSDKGDTNPAIRYKKVDVRRKINSINKSYNILFNLAAIHKTPGHDPYEYYETNILGAENICNFARKNNIKTIVYTSSIAPYGPSEEEKFEQTLPQPISPYGVSKLIAEYIHRAWASEDSARKLIIVRPGVVFGKYEN